MRYTYVDVCGGNGGMEGGEGGLKKEGSEGLVNVAPMMIGVNDGMRGRRGM